MKKGASELVAWVLIIGFSITLGIVVTQWLKEQATTSVKVVTNDIEGDLRCADVSLNVYFNPSCDTLTVSNRGYHTVASVKMRSDFGVDEYDTNVAPGQTSILSIPALGSGSHVDVIPVVAADNEKVGCIDRKIALEC